jgi:hypothetical protein
MAIIDLRHPLDDDPIPAEWLLERVRRHRDAALEDSDWTQLPDVPVDTAAWATYRQQLRDFPASWTPADTVDLPDPPA